MFILKNIFFRKRNNNNGDIMGISWIKSSKDQNSFKMVKALGLDVYEIDDVDKTDIKIKELIKHKYNTIIMSNELAGFSQDIIKKYNKMGDINIIIAPKNKTK